MQKALSIVLLGFCFYQALLYWNQQKTKWDKNYFFITLSYLMLFIWSLVCFYSSFFVSHNLFFLNLFKNYQFLLSCSVMMIVILYLSSFEKMIRPIFVISFLILVYLLSLLIAEHGSAFQFLILNVCVYYVYRRYEQFGLLARNFLSFCFFELMAMSALLLLETSSSVTTFIFISIISRFYFYHFINQIRARMKFKEINT